jgi:predicted DNA binding CopG/RHH family protein
LIESIETALESREPPKIDPEEQVRLRAMWQEALAETERKRPVTVRLQERDLRRLRVIAQEKGIPYQTLIGSILHQYVTGRMIERDGERS